MAEAWGVDMHKYSFLDIFSLEHADLDCIDIPCRAVVLLFPDTPTIVAARDNEACLDPSTCPVPWIPQVDVGHACGRFALVHAIGALDIAPNLQAFFNKVTATPVEQRTAVFASSPEIYNAHHGVITAGQSKVRESDWEDCDHFISFVYGPGECGEHVYEMDGCPPRRGPVDKGKGSGNLLKDVADIVKHQYLPLAGENIHFSMIALIG